MPHGVASCAGQNNTSQLVHSTRLNSCGGPSEISEEAFRKCRLLWRILLDHCSRELVSCASPPHVHIPRHLPNQLCWISKKASLVGGRRVRESFGNRLKICTVSCVPLGGEHLFDQQKERSVRSDN